VGVVEINIDIRSNIVVLAGSHGGIQMDEFPMDYEIFDLGDVPLQGGATLRDAKLAYKT
jgi:hypothetical protein